MAVISGKPPCARPGNPCQPDPRQRVKRLCYRRFAATQQRLECIIADFTGNEPRYCRRLGGAGQFGIAKQCTSRDLNARIDDHVSGRRQRDRLEQLAATLGPGIIAARSEEHTSELQSLMRISYSVFCLKKKTKKINTT